MKNLRRFQKLMLSTLLCCGGLGGETFANDTKSGAVVTQASKGADAKASKRKRRPRYVPPVKDAPKVRVGGGVRGVDQVALAIDVIAPDHVSLTAQSQPTLYWYQSFDGKGKAVQVSVVRPRKPKPVLKVTLDNTVVGLNEVRLADHGAALDPDVDYQWMVSYVSDKQGRWKDVLAGAMIRFQGPSKETASVLTEAPSLESVSTLLESGLWYDGWAGLMALQKQHPKNAEIREFRDDLMEQVGLKQTDAND